LLKGLLAICAPLAPHLAEDAWLSIPYKKTAESVFQAGWPSFDSSWQSLCKVSNKCFVGGLR
jgi:isoleucyl-tRNA synthetase